MSGGIEPRKTQKGAEKGLVPKLRFPEFRDAGEWKENRMGKVLKENPRPISMNDEEEYSLVTVKRRYGGVVSRGILKGKSIKVKSQFLLEENDFLISKRQIVHCACGVVPKSLAGSIVSNEYSVLRACEGFDISFIHYFSQQPIVSESFLKCSIGIVIEKMLFKLNDWLKEIFFFPIIAEQQKIADCLSSIDALITAHSQKLESLKAHKKGLMQQLFPREGETVPRLRFPDVRDAGEWEEVPLSELVDTLDAGVSVNSGDRPATIDEKGILKTSAVTDGVFNSSENKVVTDVQELNRLKEPVIKNTIIISRMNTPALVGANAYIEADHANLFLPDRLWAAKPKPGTSMRFIACILGSGQGRAALSALATGTSGSMKNIAKANVLELQVLTPSPVEQQKIADCLASIDALITAQGKKVEALKAHKKGFMQQLFPREAGA